MPKVLTVVVVVVVVVVAAAAAAAVAAVFSVVAAVIVFVVLGLRGAHCRLHWCYQRLMCSCLTQKFSRQMERQLLYYCMYPMGQSQGKVPYLMKLNSSRKEMRSSPH